MKYFFLLLILVICGLAYVRSEQPKIWNDCLAALKAPEDSSPTSPISAPPVAAAPIATASVTPPPVTAPPVATADVPTGPATSPPTRPEIISPDSTNFINPDHVKQVEQPAQASANSPKVFVPPDPLPAQANWTWTVLGQDYHNVVVTKVEADKVHIMYDGGIGSLNLADLTPDLQKMFNYDPQAAALTSHQKAAALAQAEAAEAPKIEAERKQEQVNANALAAQGTVPAGNGNNSVSPAAKVDWARNHLPGYQDDLNFVMKHVSINATTGQVYGDAYYLKKYAEDTQAITYYNQIISSGGK
jgi:hypothetical protein